jgi:hypothetical protein
MLGLIGRVPTSFLAIMNSGQPLSRLPGDSIIISFRSSRRGSLDKTQLLPLHTSFLFHIAKGNYASPAVARLNTIDFID